MANTTLNITFADLHLGVRGENFEYLFAYHQGGPASIVKDGMEWLYRPIVPALWRATTDNDHGNHFHHKSGMWLAADMFIKVKGAVVSIDGKEIPLPMGPENNKYTGQETANEVKVTHIFETITEPSTTIDISYTVSSNGSIRVDALYHGQKGLPELPVFGVRMIMPTVALGYRYEGLSGETYPDRMDGAEKGVFDIEGLPVSAYLTPQENGMHMDTEWVEVRRNKSLCNIKDDGRERVFKVEKDDKPFAFSALPYTPFELECADHKEALPLPRRTVLTICGAVRGVGGMDSWGADVEDAYHISGEEDIAFSFRIV